MALLAEVAGFPYKGFFNKTRWARGPLHASSLLTTRLQRQESKLNYFFMFLYKFLF